MFSSVMTGKYARLSAVLMVLVWVLVQPASVHSAGAPASYFDDTRGAFAAEITALDLPPLHLGVADNIKALGTLEEVQRQVQVLARWQKRLAQPNDKPLGLCARIDMDYMRNAVDRGLERARLGVEYFEQEALPPSKNGLAEFANGKAWYGYFLNAWLGTNVNPDDIFAFGLREITRANAAYDALQKQMGFEGDNAGLLAHLQQPQFFETDPARILDAYKYKQSIVRAHLARQFTLGLDVPLAKIERSPLGAQFPAPGYYDPDVGVFYFNILDKKYDLRQVDWLFIHEATPGHHFMDRAAAAHVACTSPLTREPVYAYLEGWAAYVETLGKEMGLYRRPEDEMAAIEWDMVRSARVALDVGLNYYGWSDKKALEFWHKNVRGSDDIAQREIDRMRRWPAQVVTYKYGAGAFLRTRQHMQEAQGKDFDIRAFHDLAVRYAGVSPAIFIRLVDEMIVSQP
jgi:uncharacterized protein (DUF885 family)